MNIILDIDIFFGVCIDQGSANKLVMHCLQGDFVPLMGAALLAEYADVLGREHLFSKARLSQVEREELLDTLLSHCQWR